VLSVLPVLPVLSLLLEMGLTKKSSLRNQRAGKQTSTNQCASNGPGKLPQHARAGYCNPRCSVLDLARK
jgi:hypothetical protein